MRTVIWQHGVPMAVTVEMLVARAAGSMLANLLLGHTVPGSALCCKVCGMSQGWNEGRAKPRGGNFMRPDRDCSFKAMQPLRHQKKGSDHTTQENWPFLAPAPLLVLVQFARGCAENLFLCLRRRQQTPFSRISAPSSAQTGCCVC